MLQLKQKNMLANNKNQIKSAVFNVKTALLSFISKTFHYIHKKMFWGLFSKIDEEFLKFLFVGVLNTLFSYTIYAILITFGLVPNLALFFQYILGVLWNFKTTGIIVFKNHSNRLIFKFVASYIFTFIINSVMLKILLNYLNEYLAQAILIPPVAILSFVIFKFWVFKK